LTGSEGLGQALQAMRSRSSDSARNQKVRIIHNPLIIELFQSSPPLSCGSWIINP